MFTRILSHVISCLLAFTVAAQAEAAPHPVVVELFTSQGCSSCPPADKLVGSYADSTNVLPLSFHVTYWNYIGWDDPYSKEGFTKRQHEYKGHLGRFNVYTPQAVVQGTHDVVGSRPRALEQAISKSATSAPWVNIKLTAESNGVAIAVPAGSARARLLLVGYQKKVQNPVARGENTGRTLAHRNSVVELVTLAEYTGEALNLTYKKPAGDGVAVLLQATDSGKIIGADWL